LAKKRKKNQRSTLLEDGGENQRKAFIVLGEPALGVFGIGGDGGEAEGNFKENPGLKEY